MLEESRGCCSKGMHLAAVSATSTLSLAATGACAGLPPRLEDFKGPVRSLWRAPTPQHGNTAAAGHQQLAGPPPPCPGQALPGSELFGSSQLHATNALAGTPGAESALPFTSEEGGCGLGSSAWLRSTASTPLSHSTTTASSTTTDTTSGTTATSTNTSMNGAAGAGEGVLGMSQQGLQLPHR
jgi:hypothetical protein